jgi:hypothetical protein
MVAVRAEEKAESAPAPPSISTCFDAHMLPSSWAGRCFVYQIPLAVKVKFAADGSCCKGPSIKVSHNDFSP